MDIDRFQRASKVFLEARQCDPQQLEPLLTERCGDDLGLRAEVERLLASDARSHTHDGLDAHSQRLGGAIRAAIEQVMDAGNGHSAPREIADPHVGKRIGRYQVIRRIGEGGMGAVYLAEQDNPRRMVALKIIRPGLVSRALLRRFEHEAHVLGRLQHPGIAQIFEAGMHDSGDGAQPYFAMEFVDGRQMSSFLADEQVDVRVRLELLAAIADAVEHAHQRGVIHRDLKPGNILVSRTANGLEPKILDFGVARAIDSDVQATTLHTGAGQIIGTVAYMSPEQAAGDPDDIDTRSDVYALGVIGYEALSGKPPHDLAKRTVPDALRTILESDPTRLGTMHRELAGDVETIIARAMEKDRARRYQSAAEFAADIRRHLRDDPILARPPSTIYQLRKFARRNRALVVGLAAVFVVLIAGIVGTSIGMQRALDQARKAQRMNEYLRGMIAFLDPSVTKNNQVTLRNVLDDASKRVDSELAGEPDVAAEILITIARGYSNIAEYELAAKHGKRAIELMTGLRSADDPVFALVWELVGQAYFRENKPAEAEHAYRAALAINRSAMGDANPDTLGNIRDIIHLLEIQDKAADIDELVAVARRAAEALPLESSDERVGLALEAVADVLGTQHMLEESEKLYLRAIDVLGRADGSPYAIEQRIVSTRNLSFIYEMQGRAQLAEDFNRRAVDMSIEQFGLEHEVTLISMQGWMRTLRGLGKLEESEKVARQSMEITAKLYGTDGNEYAHDLHNLAMVVRERGRPAEAIPMFQEALAIRRARLDAGDIDLIRTMSGLGMSLVDCDRGAEAVPILREAAEHRLQQLGENHSSIPGMRTIYGVALVQAGDYEEAEGELLKALPHLGSQPAMREKALQWLATLYQRWGRPEESEKYRAMLTARATTQPVTTGPTTVE